MATTTQFVVMRDQVLGFVQASVTRRGNSQELNVFELSCAVYVDVLQRTCNNALAQTAANTVKDLAFAGLAQGHLVPVDFSEIVVHAPAEVAPVNAPGTLPATTADTINLLEELIIDLKQQVVDNDRFGGRRRRMSLDSPTISSQRRRVGTSRAEDTK